MTARIENDHRKEAVRRLDQAVSNALKEIGFTVEGDAKQLCPVDTGNLRNSIENAVDGDTVYIGTNVEYASYVELGTSRTRPQPYLGPAAKGDMDDMKAILIKHIRNL